jgi:membrane-bound metal-dependent hydrolase YbcI (DUF457 family)
MTPDLEVPIIFLLTGGLQDRLILHSLMGVVTLGTFLSVLLIVFLYPRSVSFFFRLERRRVDERCRFSGILVISCVIGGFSHVLIDSMTHEFNPVFYPFFKESFDALVLLNDQFLASVIVECVLLTLLIFFFIDEIRKGSKGFWMRVLVE